VPTNYHKVLTYSFNLYWVRKCFQNSLAERSCRTIFLEKVKCDWTENTESFQKMGEKTRCYHIAIVLYLVSNLCVSSKRNKSPFKRIPIGSDDFYDSFNLFIERCEETSLLPHHHTPQPVSSSTTILESTSFKSLWTVIVLGENESHDIHLSTFYPEAILSLLFQVRVSFDDVLATASTHFDYSIHYNSIDKELTAIRNDNLLKLLEHHKVRLVKNDGGEDLSLLPAPGSVSYRRFHNTNLQLNR
jgi:hypothetical protein